MVFDVDHEGVDVVFKASLPVVLTDDVKFKFYSSNVRYWSILKSLSQPLPSESTTNWFRQVSVLFLVPYHLHSRQQVSQLLCQSELSVFSNYRLILNRGDLDNMQKCRMRRSYPPSFSIELWFEPWTVGKEPVD